MYYHVANFGTNPRLHSQVLAQKRFQSWNYSPAQIAGLKLLSHALQNAAANAEARLRKEASSFKWIRLAEERTSEDAGA